MRCTPAIRAALLAGVMSTPALAQQKQPPVTLTIEVEDAMLIVQTLGAIGCQSVQQLIMCERAVVLLRKVQDQVKAQGK